MKIALIGYGKMGREVEAFAIARGHEVVLKIDESNPYEFTTDNLKKADVAIEFTAPHSAASNILKCFEADLPVVSGTTGWMDTMEGVKAICKEKNQAFFYASNFSIGVNLFFKLNAYLASLMKDYSHYKPSMDEIHHVHKKDSPSGTALTLAHEIIKTNPRIEKWVFENDETHDNELPVVSVRVGEVTGTHTVYYTSESDEIKITHEASNRKGFAEGAVRAAEWLIDKKGVFGMNDLLEL